ncbi:HAD family hydrolase [Streptomyces sp. NPDC088197]|uniref:HAD family hydrolase n=1 Tax=Streptomyces sp. NPDC088197 TaxID=3365840 RepID=UPI003830992F
MKPSISLLVTDLDNTLWDWFGAWHASFSAMLTRLSELSEVPEEVLVDEIREVHQRRGTTEYSLLLNELPSLLNKKTRTPPLEYYDDAIHIQNRQRILHTSLYPGVMGTLHGLKEKGVRIVAYTESVAYWSEWRIKATGLDGVIEVLYSAPDHDFPTGVSTETLRTKPASDYGLNKTTHNHVPAGIIKPNTQVLSSILASYASDPHKSLYVGDSLMKDVSMAQKIGVHDAYASYGTSIDKIGYDLLRRVSHWSNADIERERRLTNGLSVIPSHTLDQFSDIMNIFEFEAS